MKNRQMCLRMFNSSFGKKSHWFELLSLKKRLSNSKKATGYIFPEQRRDHCYSRKKLIHMLGHWHCLHVQSRSRRRLAQPSVHALTWPLLEALSLEAVYHSHSGELRTLCVRIAGAEDAKLLHAIPQGWRAAAVPRAQSSSWVVLPAWSIAHVPWSHWSNRVSNPSDWGRTASGSTQLELGLNLSFPFSCNPHLIFSKQQWTCSSYVLY